MHHTFQYSYMTCLDFTLVAYLLSQVVAKSDETCNTTHMNILVLAHQLSSPSIDDTPSPTNATTWKSLFLLNYCKTISRKHQEYLFRIVHWKVKEAL